MAIAGNVTISGKQYSIHYFKGKVLDSQKTKETKVSGSGGGGYNGHSSPVSITSRTIDHHELFLQDSGGTERSFKFTDWDFPCREGQTMTILWVIPEGRKNGSYFGVINHNTGEEHILKPKHIASEFGRPWWLNLGIIAGATFLLQFVIGFWPALIVSGISVPIYATITSRQAARRFLESQEMKKLEAVLATA